MSVKIPLSYTIAGAISLFALSASFGAKMQHKYYKYLIKLAFFTENEDTRKLATSILRKDLNLRYEPASEDK